METNLKVEEQRLEIRKLRMENAALRHEIPKAGKGQPQKKQPPAAVASHDNRIAPYGRKFGVMNEIFVSLSAFLVEDPGFDPTDNACYKDPASTMKGVIAKLFKEVPEDLHKFMKEHTHFRDLVSCYCLSWQLVEHTPSSY